MLLKMSSTETPIEVNFRIFIPRDYSITRLLSLIHQSDGDLGGEIYLDDFTTDEDEELEKALKILLQNPPSDVHLYI